MNRPEDALEEGRLRMKRLWFINAVRKCNLIFDVCVSTLITIGFALVKYADVLHAAEIDVRQICNDSNYNVTLVPDTYGGHVYVSLSFMIVVCGGLSFFKNRIEQGKFNKMVYSNTLWELWILVMNTVFLAIFVELIKCIFGIPRPYFFSNPDIKKHFCGNSKEKKLTKELEKLVDTLRKSFPSSRAAACVYSVAVMCLYIGHYDTRRGLRSTQHLILIIWSLNMIPYFAIAVDIGENHLSDVWGGAIFGFIQAMIAVRSIFGGVFYSLPASPDQLTCNIINYYQPNVPPTEPVNRTRAASYSGSLQQETQNVTPTQMQQIEDYENEAV